MSRTRLIQDKINDPMDSIDRFSNIQNNEVPLVLFPAERSSCSCYMNVPSGVLGVMHRFGADYSPDASASPNHPNYGNVTEHGALAPAGFLCLPCWYNVVYIVNQQAITYNVPLKACPTKDNVMVDCDLTLVFNIGPRPDHVKQFVYKLGAVRFDDFLLAAAEEGVRCLVRSITHDMAYELRGNEQVKPMLKSLNQKFGPFGISFTRAAITEVRFPSELARTLQETTEYDAQMENESRTHDHEVKKIVISANQEMEKLRQQNARTLQELIASQRRAETSAEAQDINARSQFEVNVTKTRQMASVQEKRADSEKQVAKSHGEKEKESIIAKAQADFEASKIEVDIETSTAIYESDCKVTEAQSLAEAIRVEAEAEAKAAESLRIKREHDLRTAQLEVLEALAKTSKIVISGDNGDRLIHSLLTAIDADTVSVAK